MFINIHIVYCALKFPQYLADPIKIKFFQKNIKKRVDKRVVRWYYIQALERAAQKSQKKHKKVLTKRIGCAKI